MGLIYWIREIIYKKNLLKNCRVISISTTSFAPPLLDLFILVHQSVKLLCIRNYDSKQKL